MTQGFGGFLRLLNCGCCCGADCRVGAGPGFRGVLFCLFSWGESGKHCSPVILTQLVCKVFTACPGSFPSNCGEKYPEPKSCWEVDPDQLGYTTSCQKMKRTGFWSPTPDFCN